MLMTLSQKPGMHTASIHSFTQNVKGRDTRCDKSRRHVAATSRLVCTAAATSRLRLVCRCDMSHEFKPVWICATDRSDKILSQRQWFSTCHTRRFVAATCRGDVSQRFVASCVSALSFISVWNVLAVSLLKTVLIPTNITTNLYQVIL